MNGPIKRVDVLYPRGVRTGGPKCLHQLVDTLRRFGQEAYLVPLPGTHHRSRVAEYEKYDAPEKSEPMDSSDVIVVTPETSFRAVRKLRQSQIAVWWLSVDFAVPFELSKAGERGASWQKKARIVLRNTARGEYGSFDALLRRHPSQVRHFAHSQYARATVEAHLGLEPVMLSDYTEPENSEDAQVYSQDVVRVGNRVAFNPKKGSELVRAIARGLPEIDFVPLKGLPFAEVVRTLKSSSLYLDLGHFPGKDHLPREAVRAGTPILLGRRGAARYEADFPHLDGFVLDTERRNWEAIRTRVREIVENPLSATQEQAKYKASLLQEREVFEREVQDAFLLDSR